MASHVEAKGQATVAMRTLQQSFNIEGGSRWMYVFFFVHDIMAVYM